MLAPAGTPAEIIARLNAETVKVLTLPDVKSRLDATRKAPNSGTPEEFGRHIQEEIAKWAKVVKALDLRVD